MWNPATDDLRVSDSLHELLNVGSTPGFESFIAASVPGDRPRLIATRDRIESGQAKGLDETFRIHSESGETRTLRLHAHEVPASESGPAIVAGTLSGVAPASEYEARLHYLEAALDASWDGVFLCDAETFDYFYVNEGVCRYTGYSRDELLHMSSMDLNTDLDRQQIRQAVDGLRSGAQPFFLREGVHRHRDGRSIPIESRTHLVEVPGHPPRLFAVARDLTERRRAEAEIALLKASIDNSPTCVLIAEAPDGRISYVNDAVRAFRGLSRDQIVGTAIADYVKTWKSLGADGVPLDGSRMVVARALFEGETIVNEEVIVELDTGEQRTVMASAAPVVIGGEIVAASVMWYDITDQARLVAALEQSNADNRRFKSVLDAAIDGIFIWDADTIMLEYVNAGACAYTGYSAEELLGKPADYLNPDLEAATVRTLFTELVAGRVQSTMRTGVHLDKSGRRIPVEVRTQYIDVPGLKPCFVSVARDVSERHANEAQITKLNHSLDQIYDSVFIVDAETLKFTYANRQASVELGYTDEAFLELGPVDIDVGLSHGQAQDWVQALREGTRANVTDERRFVDKEGSEFPVELALQYVHNPDDHDEIVCIARNISARQRRQAYVTQLSVALDRIRDAVFIYDAESLRFVYVNQSALDYLGYAPDEMLQMGAADVNASRSAEQIRAEIAAVRNGTSDGLGDEIEQRAKDGRLIPFEPSMSYVDEPGARPRIVSVARDVSDRVKARAEARHYRQRLETQAAELTRKNAALADREAQLRDLFVRFDTVRESERAENARDIHDVLGQALTVIKLELSRHRDVAQLDATEQARITRMLAELDECMANVRRIATSLRPAILDDLGLVPAIRTALREFGERTDLKCVVEAAAEPVLSGDAKIALYRIVQEALTNVARHAHASSIKVSVTEREGHCELLIDDDGIGLLAGGLPAGRSMGLLGMRERAEGLGGEVNIGVSPRGGVQVHARVPVGS